MKGSCVSCICSSGNENGQCENKRVNINTSIADKHRASFKQIFLRSVLSKFEIRVLSFALFHACSGKWANGEGFAKCAHRNTKPANLFSCFIWTCGPVEGKNARSIITRILLEETGRSIVNLKGSGGRKEKFSR